MSETPMLRHGAFSWCELMTSNAEAPKRFYTELLGWTTEEVPGMFYTIVKTGEVGIGGIMSIPPHAAGASPYWGTYVTVDDVDATARKAQELGATGSARGCHLHHYPPHVGSHRVRCGRGTGSPCPTALVPAKSDTLPCPITSKLERPRRRWYSELYEVC